MEAAAICDALGGALEAWEVQRLLGGPYDDRGAVLSIQVCVCGLLQRTHHCTAPSSTALASDCTLDGLPPLHACWGACHQAPPP